MFHNIFFLIIVFLIGKLLLKKLSKEELLFPIMFYASSHILLDLFDSYGIGLFYPLILKNVYAYITLSLSLTSLSSIIFVFNYGFSPSNVILADKLSIIDSIGFISLFLLVVAYIIRRRT